MGEADRGGGRIVKEDSDRMKKDIAYLEYQISKTAPRNLVLILAAAAVIVVVGGFNIWLSSKYASASGHAFGDVFSGWLSGVSMTETYPGVYIKAMERFETGIIEIAISLLAVIQVARWHADRKRYVRILEYLGGKNG